MTSYQKLLGGIGESFSDRNFRIHSIGAIASWISFFIQIVAVSWVAWELTQSTKWLAIISLLDIIPNILLLPFGGALADRFDRYKIMMCLNPLLLIQAVVITLLAYFGLLTIWWLSLLVLIHGVLLSFSVPAMYGMLPRFVDKSVLSSAIAVNSAYAQFAIFAGPAIAGWIISAYSAAIAFAVNAVGYAILIISMSFLKTPIGYQQSPASTSSITSDIVDGVKYIFEQKGIAALLVIALAGEALAAGIYHMAPAYADEFLNMGVTGVSLLLSSIGVGATISAIWLARGGTDVLSMDRVLWAFFLFSISIAMLFLTKNLYLIIVFCVVVGITVELYSTGTLSMIQLAIEDSQRGRVMGNLWGMKQIAAGIGTYIIGAYAVSKGLAPPMLIAVGLCLVVWLLIYRSRSRLKLTIKRDTLH